VDQDENEDGDQCCWKDSCSKAGEWLEHCTADSPLKCQCDEEGSGNWKHCYETPGCNGEDDEHDYQDDDGQVDQDEDEDGDHCCWKDSCSKAGEWLEHCTTDSPLKCQCDEEGSGKWKHCYEAPGCNGEDDEHEYQDDDGQVDQDQGDDNLKW
jgi:hypothetical protein